MSEDDAAQPGPQEPAAEPEAAIPPRGKPTKAEKLEAKAARLREQAQRRAADAAAGVLPPRRGLLISTAALAVVAAALATLLVITFLAWQHQKDITADRVAAATKSTAALDASRAAAVAAAKSFALDFGSYDYQHLDTEFQEVAQKMTPSFAKSYLATSDKLKATFEQYKTQVTAQIQGWGVTSATASHAVVVVFLDQTVRTSQSSTPRIDRNRLEIQLELTDGKWLVSKLLAK